MKWDSTFTLSALVNVLTLIAVALGGWFAFKAKIEIFEQTLRHHAEALSIHAARMETYERRMFEIVQTLSRLVGRSDIELKDQR